MHPQPPIVQHNLMKTIIALSIAFVCLFFSSCHRPVAYFQRTPHPAAARLSVPKPVDLAVATPADSVSVPNDILAEIPAASTPLIASLKNQPAHSASTQVERRMRRIQSALSVSSEPTDKQPDPRPKPKKKLRLGNQIRQSLGMKLRPELNWWQRISWKLKASVIVLLVAVVFAILHITILAIIFGIIGAFLLISGLKRSFKIRRPWF